MDANCLSQFLWRLIKQQDATLWITMSTKKPVKLTWKMFHRVEWVQVVKVRGIMAACFRVTLQSPKPSSWCRIAVLKTLMSTRAIKDFHLRKDWQEVAQNGRFSTFQRVKPHAWEMTPVSPQNRPRDNRSKIQITLHRLQTEFWRTMSTWVKSANFQ